MARTLREIVEREKPEVVQRAKNLASEMLLDIHLTASGLLRREDGAVSAPYDAVTAEMRLNQKSSE